MMRTRASIKGIGATIFHDSDIPESSLLPRSNRYLFAAREPAKAAAPEPEAPLPKASPAPQQAEQAGPAAKPESAAGSAGISYSTEDLIALLDAEAQAGVTEAELARLARAAVQGGALPAEQAAVPESSPAAAAVQAVPLAAAAAAAPVRMNGAAAPVPQAVSTPAPVPETAGFGEPAAARPRNGNGTNGSSGSHPSSASLAMAVLALPPGQAPDDGAADAVGAQAAAAAEPESVGGESLVAAHVLAPLQEMPARHGLCEETASRLSEEVFVLYDRISRPAIARADVTQRCLDGLSEARNLLLLGDPGNLNLAERRVNQVKYAINRVDQTNRWGKSYGWTLFGFELAALALVVVALLLDQRLAWSISMALGSAAPAASMAELFGPWNMMLWGAIGGIIGALYSLHWHVSVQQDFDRQYTLWYVVQPFMGFVFGGLSYLVVMIGLLILVPGASYSDTAQWFPALLACLVGFRQKFAYEMLDGLTGVFERRLMPAEA